MKQKQKLSPQRVIICLTGVLFAAYAAYYVFVFFRDSSSLNIREKFISVLVAVMFSLLAFYALSHAVKRKKGPLFLIVRKAFFIIALLALLWLKLRMLPMIAAYWEPAKPYTVMYDIAYFLTVGGLLLLLFYYVIIRKRALFLPRTAVILPAAAAFCFLCSFLLDAILFFAFHVLFEANLLRTVVRPVFYLSFIGLSAYFMYPPTPMETPRPASVKPPKTEPDT